MAPPMFIITPNPEALDALAALLRMPEDEHEEAAWETVIPLRITRGDLQRYMYGNGDLIQIGIWIDRGEGDAVAFPDAETPASPFDS